MAEQAHKQYFRQYQINGPRFMHVFQNIGSMLNPLPYLKNVLNESSIKRVLITNMLQCIVT